MFSSDHCFSDEKHFVFALSALTMKNKNKAILFRTLLHKNLEARKVNHCAPSRRLNHGFILTLSVPQHKPALSINPTEKMPIEAMQLNLVNPKLF